MCDESVWLLQVPNNQIIDTADLYRLPSQKRYIALRFLAWYFFGEYSASFSCT